MNKSQLWEFSRNILLDHSEKKKKLALQELRKQLEGTDTSEECLYLLDLFIEDTANASKYANQTCFNESDQRKLEKENAASQKYAAEIKAAEREYSLRTGR